MRSAVQIKSTCRDVIGSPPLSKLLLCQCGAESKCHSAHLQRGSIPGHPRSKCFAAAALAALSRGGAAGPEVWQRRQRLGTRPLFSASAEAGAAAGAVAALPWVAVTACRARWRGQRHRQWRRGSSAAVSAAASDVAAAVAPVLLLLLLFTGIVFHFTAAGAGAAVRECAAGKVHKGERIDRLWAQGPWQVQRQKLQQR